MESAAISAHGMQVLHRGTALENLGDVTPPALIRKAIERTTHGDEDDAYRVSIRNFGSLQFDVGWSDSVTLANLFDAWATDTDDEYEVLFPGGGRWTFSGFVETIAPRTPVDGPLVLLVTVRPAQAVSFITGVNFILLESGDHLLQESGSRLFLE